MATQTGPALWFKLAGGHYRITAVASKAVLVGGQSCLVSTEVNTENCLIATIFRVSLGVGIGRLYTAIVKRSSVYSWSQKFILWFYTTPGP
jgi:hypothetical protein